MTQGFPKIEMKVARKFRAMHSLPRFGNPEPHWHDYVARIGYMHEIAPFTGATKSIDDVISAVDPVIAKIDGKNLNELMAAWPTAEFVAMWILRELPPYFDFVEVDAYEVLTVRVDRNKCARLNWLDVRT